MKRENHLCLLPIAALLGIGIAHALKHPKTRKESFSLGRGYSMQNLRTIAAYKCLRKIQCACKCVSVKRCQSFSFHGDRKTCALHGSDTSAMIVKGYGTSQHYVKDTGCPSSYIWLSNDMFCFKISKSSETVPRSEETCKKDHTGGRLAVLDTSNKFAAVKSQLRTQFYVWVGARRNRIGEVPTWNDGSTIKKSFWARREPNSHRAKCVNLVVHANFYFNDEHCGYNCNYICEIRGYA